MSILSSTGSTTEDWCIIVVVYIHIYWLLLYYYNAIYNINTYRVILLIRYMIHQLELTWSTWFIFLHMTTYFHTVTALPVIGYLFYAMPSGLFRGAWQCAPHCIHLTRCYTACMMCAFWTHQPLILPRKMVNQILSFICFMKHKNLSTLETQLWQKKSLGELLFTIISINSIN